MISQWWCWKELYEIELDYHPVLTWYSATLVMKCWWNRADILNKFLHHSLEICEEMKGNGWEIWFPRLSRSFKSPYFYQISPIHHLPCGLFSLSWHSRISAIILPSSQPLPQRACLPRIFLIGLKCFVGGILPAKIRIIRGNNSNDKTHHTNEEGDGDVTTCLTDTEIAA
jgi:hypothetical protein